MLARKMMVQSVALAMGLMGPIAAIANPQGSTPGPAPSQSANEFSAGLSSGISALSAGYSLLDLPPVMSRLPLPVLVAQAGSSQKGLIFDASQISPLGDPAWVASLRGPDPSRPALNLGNFEATVATVPRSGGSGGNDRVPDGAFRRGDSTVRNGQILNNGRVYLIGAERSTLSKAGSILLAPGRAAELGDLRVPFVRVYVSAPAGSSLDVDRLVSQRPAIGMFSALFAPAPARRGDSGATAIASVSAPDTAGSSVRISAITAVESVAPAAMVVAYAAPVAERSVALLPIPPAQVEERVLIAFMAPIEDRSGNQLSIPPASVEERSFVAFIAPVEERSGLLVAIPPALVEERSFVAFVAPVEDRSALLARLEVERAPARGIGKPVPGQANQAELIAAKHLTAVSAGLVQVAFAAPVVVVAAKETAQTRSEARDLAPIPVKLAAVQKRLPTVMVDRKGGFFFM